MGFFHTYVNDVKVTETYLKLIIVRVTNHTKFETHKIINVAMETSVK